MKLEELTAKIKIDREFDAEVIHINELARHVFTIYDYELRETKNKDNQSVNWLRMLIGIPEFGEDGLPTGNVRRFVFKTEAVGMVQFMMKIDAVVKKTGHNPCPIEECEIENVCGYMFKDSTNREYYCTDGNTTLPKSSLAESMRIGQAITVP